MLKISSQEKLAIHSILDEAEHDAIGVIEPYSTIQLLDEQCQKLWPEWEPSRFSTPLLSIENPNNDQDSETEIVASFENDESFQHEEFPKLEVGLDKEIDILKNDLRKMIVKISRKVHKVPEIPNFEESESETISSISEPESETSQSVTRIRRKKKTKFVRSLAQTKTAIAQVEKEIETVKEQNKDLLNLLKTEKRNLKNSQDNINKMKVAFKRSEKIRQQIALKYSMTVGQDPTEIAAKKIRQRSDKMHKF